MISPGLERQRECGGALTRTDDGKPFLPVFPPVAVRAVKDRPAVALLEAGDAACRVLDARREQQVSPPLSAAVGQADLEALVGARRGDDGQLAQLDDAREDPAIDRVEPLGIDTELGRLRENPLGRGITIVERDRELVLRCLLIIHGDDGAAPDGSFPRLALIPSGAAGAVASLLRRYAGDARAATGIPRPGYIPGTPAALLEKLIQHAVQTVPARETEELARGLEGLAGMLDGGAVADPLASLAAWPPGRLAVWPTR